MNLRFFIINYCGFCYRIRYANDVFLLVSSVQLTHLPGTPNPSQFRAVLLLGSLHRLITQYFNNMTSSWLWICYVIVINQVILENAFHRQNEKELYMEITISCVVQFHWFHCYADSQILFISILYWCRQLVITMLYS